MPEPTLNDLGVEARAVGTVEDDILADAQARATAAEQDDFEQSLFAIDDQLKQLRAEERVLVRQNAKSKLSSIRKRIETALGRRKALIDAHDERKRIATAGGAASIAVSDDKPAGGESERDFLIRTGKLTPFQGQNGYERRTGSAPDIIAKPTRRRLSDFAHQHVVNYTRDDVPQRSSDDGSEEPPSLQEFPVFFSSIEKAPSNNSKKRPRVSSHRTDSDDEGGSANCDDEDYKPATSPPCSDEEDVISPSVLSAKKRKKAPSRKEGGKDGDDVQKGDEDEEDRDEDGPEGADVVINEEEELELEGGLRFPASVYDRLFAYQKTGVQWLWEIHNQKTGGILGDEMGLGKTVQIVAFLAALDYSNQLNGHVIVIAPTTVLRQWKREFRAWWPRFRVRILHHSEDKPKGRGNINRKVTRRFEKKFDPKSVVEETISEPHGVLITSYEQVRKNPDILLEHFEYVIADEGHKLKSPDAEITITCKKFDTPHRIIVSGSPLQNHLKELWSLFDFVFPGKLGTLPVFHAQFVVPITTGGYSTANKTQVHTAYKCSMMLRDTVSPFLLKRLKKDVAKQLPEKNEQILFVKLTPEQREKYKKFIGSHFVRQVLNGRLNLLYAVTALRKVCNHFDIPIHKSDQDKELYGSPFAKALGPAKGMEIVGPAPKFNFGDEQNEELEDYGNMKRSGKMIVLDRVLDAWKKVGSRALVFSQTTTMLDILERYVKRKGFEYLRMDGTTAIGSRMELIDRFNFDTSIFIFLLTTRVGGLGVNLTGADRVVLFDPDWNPSTDLQARERAWRIGQKRPVTVYRLITSGTIEEKIFHRQIYKQFLTNKVLTDPRQRRFFKPKDIRDLFSLAEDDEDGTETGDIFAGTGAKEVKASEVERHKNDANSEKDPKQAKEGNASVLNSLLDDDDSNGVLQSMMNHDEIIGAGTSERDSTLVEYEAERAAEDAMSELQRSAELRRQQSIAVPTWTGRSGLAGIIANNSRGGASSLGGSKGSSLLEKIKAREGKTSATSVNDHNSTNTPRVDDNKTLLGDLINFLRSRGGQSTSQEIVSHFEERVKNAEVFKSMLKTIADLNKGAGPGGTSLWVVKTDAMVGLE